MTPDRRATNQIAITPVDRSDPLPLWAQLHRQLSDRLGAGEFVERFPTDQELIEQYGVSRHTVRDAVKRLQAAGLLDRERGRGTFVRRVGIEQPLGTLYSLFRSIEERGFEQRSVVRELNVRRSAEAAGMLELPARTPLVYLERLRLADGDPIALDCSWLPASIGKPLLHVDFTHTALYAELTGRCGVRPDGGWERISPALPTFEQRKLLSIPARQPVFAIERVARQGRRAIEWRHSVVRGDLFSFVARWAGTAMETRLELINGAAS